MAGKPKLTRRLQMILDQGIPGEDFWDVCCDHGYLGEYALSRGHFTKVHFVDQVSHIMESLLTRLEKRASRRNEAMPAALYAIAGEDIPVPVEGTLVIAGVGGLTQIKILRALQERALLQAQRIILNPYTHKKALLEYLESLQGYRLLETLPVVERNKTREILVLESVSK